LLDLCVLASINPLVALDQPAGGTSLTHCRRLAIPDWSDLSIE